MKRALAPLAFLVLARADASPLDWSDGQKTLTGSLLLCEAYDVSQTVYARDTGGRELNPAFGSHPSDARLAVSKLLALVFILWVAERHPQQRGLVLAATNAVCAGAIAFNWSGGLRP